MDTIGGAPPIPATAIASANVRYFVLAAVLQVLSTVAVVLRFLSRRLVQAIGWDDWASLAALIFSAAHTASVVLCASDGRGGFHLAGYTYPQLGEFMKDVLVYNLSLIFTTTCSKLALLRFYRRVFPTKSMRTQVWIFVAFVLGAYWLAGCCMLIFSHDPIDSQWNLSITPRRALDTKLVFEYIVVADMVTDIGILCLPQKLVWKLQLPLRRRLLLSLLFLLGAFTCVTTILRLYYVIKTDADFTSQIVEAGLWGTVESHLTIIIGCAPVFPKLFRHWFAGQQSSKRAHSDSNSGTPSSQTHRNDSESGKSAETLQPSLTHSIKDKNIVRIQTDIEIGHIERCVENMDNNNLARQYRWKPSQ